MLNATEEKHPWIMKNTSKVSDLALSLSTSSSSSGRRSGSVSGPSIKSAGPVLFRSASPSCQHRRQPRKKKKTRQNDSSPDFSTSAIQDDDDYLLNRESSSDNSSRRSSSTSAPPGVIYGAGGGASRRKVIRSHLDTSARLHAIDFPMQFNFGSPYGASVSIMFDQ